MAGLSGATLSALRDTALRFLAVGGVHLPDDVPTAGQVRLAVGVPALDASMFAVPHASACVPSAGVHGCSRPGVTPPRFSSYLLPGPPIVAA